MFSNDPKTLIAQVAKVLDAIRKKYPYSDELKALDIHHPLFHDSCNFVGLHYEISSLASLLEALIRIDVYLTESENPNS